jgi:hypothetical protein
MSLPTFIRTEGKGYGQYLCHVVGRGADRPAEDPSTYGVVAWSAEGKWSALPVSIPCAMRLQRQGTPYVPQRLMLGVDGRVVLTGVVEA